MHHNRRCLGELIRFKHLPLVNTNATPGRRAIVINTQAPLLCRHRLLQQHIRYCIMIVANAHCLDPFTVLVLVFQGKIQGIHIVVFTAVFRVFHTPAADRHFPTHINTHGAGALIGGAPLGVIGRSAVNGLGSRLTAIFRSHIGDFRIQAHIDKFHRCFLLRSVVVIQPIDGQLCCRATHTIAVDGQHFQHHIFLLCIPHHCRQIQCRVGRLHQQATATVRLQLIHFIGSCAFHCIPIQSHFCFVGIPVENVIQLRRFRCHQRIPLLIQNGQLTQVDLQLLYIAFRGHFNAQCIQQFACSIGNIHHASGPAFSIACRQRICYLLASFITVSIFVTVIGNQLHFCAGLLIGQTQLHTALHRHKGAVEHDSVGFSCLQVTIEADGIAAIVGIGKIIAAFQLCTFRIDDPGPGGHHILIGLIAPGGQAGKLTIHPIAGTMTGIKVGHKRRGRNGRFICKEAGHTHPFTIDGAAGIGSLHTGIASRIGIKILLDLMEHGAIRRQTQSRIGAIQCQ